jgi:hypothetical protein
LIPPVVLILIYNLLNPWSEFWISERSASIDAYFDSSSSDDSDWESDDDEIEDMLLLLVVQNLHDEDNQKRKRQGSAIVRLLIPRNRAMGSEMLMRDYFA